MIHDPIETHMSLWAYRSCKFKCCWQLTSRRQRADRPVVARRLAGAISYRDGALSRVHAVSAYSTSDARLDPSVISFSAEKRLAASDRTISQDRVGQDALFDANYRPSSKGEAAICLRVYRLAMYVRSRCQSFKL